MPFKVNPFTGKFDKVNPKPEFALDDLTDVNAPSPTDNDALTWDDVTSKWIPEATSYRRTATKVVAASDSLDTTNADYVCDGTADEVEINQAITELATTGGTVMLLEGTFTIDAGININQANVMLKGQGSGTLILTSKELLGMINVSVSDCAVIDVHLQGGGTGDSIYGIYGISGTSLSIRGCTFEDMGWAGVLLNGLDRCVITSCFFRTIAPYGVSIGSSSDRIVVVGNVFRSCRNGVYTSGNGGCVTGNQMYQDSGGQYGVYALGSLNTVSNNVILDGDGMRFDVTRGIYVL